MDLAVFCLKSLTGLFCSVGFTFSAFCQRLYFIEFQSHGPQEELFFGTGLIFQIEEQLPLFQFSSQLHILQNFLKIHFLKKQEVAHKSS